MNDCLKLKPTIEFKTIEMQNCQFVLLLQAPWSFFSRSDNSTEALTTRLSGSSIGFV